MAQGSIHRRNYVLIGPLHFSIVLKLANWKSMCDIYIYIYIDQIMLFKRLSQKSDNIEQQSLFH